MTEPDPAPPDPAARPYHHGALRTALLDAAWSIVAEQGLEGLTMRACARRAGVSHAAPIHHFGNIAGLSAELAAVGYERLAAAMAHAADGPGRDPLQSAGLGYIRFAVTYPAHFRLMSGISVIDTQSTRLREARNAARLRLVDALRDACRQANGAEPDDISLAERTALAWSCVHGYAALRVDGSVERFGLPQAERVLAQLRPALIAP